VTLLWALRSPCNLGCRYCYFGTVEDHRGGPPTGPGQLSHLSRTDLTFAEIDRFLTTIATSSVGRVFLAGGEPLIWPHAFAVVDTLKAAGVQVVICTNGLPLNRPEITGRILDLDVDGVSVSLDSADAAYNDSLRPSRTGTHGWSDVVAGVRRLVAGRGHRRRPKIGIYSVVTRSNVESVRDTAALAADLGLDYYVPQPISLAPGHPLHDELSLRPEDRPRVVAGLDRLYQAGLPLSLPDRSYVHRFAAAATTEPLGFVRSCFGGRNLYFIQPDGSVWDCPSHYKISATPPSRRRSIRGATAAEVFGPQDQASCTDCHLFSRDCVSMWPLMGFDSFLRRAGPA
jgi:MoaA/NifB/PqqE/SkfB family radical SAM enzyme